MVKMNWRVLGPAEATDRRVPEIALHLTNVQGVGATRLAEALLPALERSPDCVLGSLYVPDRGSLGDYERHSKGPVPERYRRYAPNAVSRVWECTFGSGRFDRGVPLLVLGDLPLRVACRQLVFVQNSHLVSRQAASLTDSVKYGLARSIFRQNLRFASCIVVQTRVMEEALLREFPPLAGRVHVIAQPVPEWLAPHRNAHLSRSGNVSGPLRLLYPAALYPHKNHSLIRRAADLQGLSAMVASLTVTIAARHSPLRDVPWVIHAGTVPPQQMVKLYSDADAVLFVSDAESYGFPLIEAMWLGLPLVCPDLPYARTLCGEQAIYFERGNPESLAKAISVLKDRLISGWRPDWGAQLAVLPADWDHVAREMVALLLSGQSMPGRAT
jgi:glycosyltransferase involved in cell wall biosynthesis